jgi:hypothetical protein
MTPQFRLNVKTAAKHAPGLKSVADQLGERFKAMGNRRAKPEPSTAQLTL